MEQHGTHHFNSRRRQPSPALKRALKTIKPAFEKSDCPPEQVSVGDGGQLSKWLQNKGKVLCFSPQHPAWMEHLSGAEEWRARFCSAAASVLLKSLMRLYADDAGLGLFQAIMDAGSHQGSSSMRADTGHQRRR